MTAALRGARIQGQQSLANYVRRLFGTGVQGSWITSSAAAGAPWYQDSVGTTQVTAVEQAVGFAVDRSLGGVLGPELVVNGDFSSATGWTAEAGWMITGGQAVATAIANNSSAVFQVGAIAAANKWYEITYQITSYTAGRLRVDFGGVSSVMATAVGVYRSRVFTTGTGALAVRGDSGPTTAAIDNISVKLLDGNHAIQATAPSRPVYGSRLNLLTKTEDFTDVVWSGSGGRTANTTLAPNGSLTADTLNFASGDTRFQRLMGQPAGVVGILSCYVKASATGGAAKARLTTTNGSTYNTGISQRIDLTTQWQLITLSGVLSTGTTIDLAVSTFDAAGVADPTCVGNIDVWGMQLELGTVASRYQRVNTATDYDTVGFPTFLKFDGIDDSLSSATGGGGTAGFFFCAAVQVDGGAGTTRVLLSDAAANGGYQVSISISGSLTLQAGNGTVYAGVGTANINIGQLYLMTAYDDGVNLVVQLNTSAPVSTGRPAVVAGTAAVTYGKANGAASAFLPGKIYESVYVRNSGLTAAQRLQIQRLVARSAGI